MQQKRLLISNQFDVTHEIIQDSFDREIYTFIQDSNSPIENSLKPIIINLETSLFRTDEGRIFLRTVGNQTHSHQNYCLIEKVNVALKIILRLMD